MACRARGAFGNKKQALERFLPMGAIVDSPVQVEVVLAFARFCSLLWCGMFHVKHAAGPRPGNRAYYRSPCRRWHSVLGLRGARASLTNNEAAVRSNSALREGALAELELIKDAPDEPGCCASICLGRTPSCWSSWSNGRYVSRETQSAEGDFHVTCSSTRQWTELRMFLSSCWACQGPTWVARRTGYCLRFFQFDVREIRSMGGRFHVKHDLTPPKIVPAFHTKFVPAVLRFFGVRRDSAKLAPGRLVPRFRKGAPSVRVFAQGGNGEVGPPGASTGRGVVLHPPLNRTRWTGITQNHRVQLNPRGRQTGPPIYPSAHLL